MEEHYHRGGEPSRGMQLKKLQLAGVAGREVNQGDNYEVPWADHKHLDNLILPDPNDVVATQFIKKKGVAQRLLTKAEEASYLDKFMLQTDLYDLGVLLSSQKFAIKKYKDSVYRGEIDSNLRNGFGVCTYENGRVYEGFWLSDLRHGKGFEKFSNGNQYIGDYARGKVIGKGTYHWVNGDVYDGEWVSGVKHGYGVWKGSNGDQYIGQWVSNQAHGYGVHEWANGDRYEGEWRYCLRHGKGQDVFANGDTYLGEYVYGKAEGYGQYKWANGNNYSGTFKDGMKEGKGIWRKSFADNCNTYEGEYHLDMKHGQGEFRWETGGVYRGRYTSDYKEGYGEMYWADGSFYKGSWIKGVQHGLGIIQFADGMQKAGLFQQNVLVELLQEKDQIHDLESLFGPFPDDFKAALASHLRGSNLTSQDIPKGKLKQAKQEDPYVKSSFDQMQDFAHAPWRQPNSNVNRDDFVDQARKRDQEEAEAAEAARRAQSNLSEEPVLDPQLNTLADTEDGTLVYHDFDYVGYDQADSFEAPFEENPHEIQSTEYNVHGNKQKSARDNHNSSYNTRGPTTMTISTQMGRGPSPPPRRVKKRDQFAETPIPEKIKRGRSPKQADPYKQKIYPEVKRQRDRSRPEKPPLKVREEIDFFIENQQSRDRKVRKKVPKSENLDLKYRPPLPPQDLQYKMPPIKTSQHPTPSKKLIRANPQSQLTVYPAIVAEKRRDDFRSKSNSRHHNSESPSRIEGVKMMKNKAWIPNGHQNSIGRNHLATIARPLNLLYQRTTGSIYFN